LTNGTCISIASSRSEKVPERSGVGAPVPSTSPWICEAASDWVPADHFALSPVIAMVIGSAGERADGLAAEVARSDSEPTSCLHAGSAARWS
jgi:hypothetical protein